jgi:hypothetical protein
MANKYFTQLTQLAAGSIASGDAMAIEDISAGETKYSTVSDFATYVSSTLGAASGEWTAVADSWAYLGAGTVSIPAGGTLIYGKGDKIKFVQGGTQLYFYATEVGGTTIAITGGSDYTLGTAAISSIYYSKVENPLNFPGSFAFAATMTGSTGSIGSYAEDLARASFSIVGKRCFVSVSKRITNKGSWATDVRTALPIMPSALVSPVNPITGLIVASGALITKALPVISGSQSYLAWHSTLNTGVIAWSSLAVNDFVYLNFSYEY